LATLAAPRELITASPITMLVENNFDFMTDVSFHSRSCCSPDYCDDAQANG
jgi:hypothetical protein